MTFRLLRSLPMLLSLGALALSFQITAAQETIVCADGEQAIAHALGTACVVETPERIIALEWTYAEDLLALGIQPIGVADIQGYHRWLKIPVTLDEAVIDVGTRQEPNLELIASLNPDLIIAPSFRVTENFDDLSAIAPTLAFNGYPTDGTTHYEEMVNTLNTIAQATGRDAEAAQVLAGLDARFALAATALEQAGRTGESFILAQGYLSSDIPTFRLFTDNAMAVEMLAKIGLENAWDDAPQLYGFSEIGIEGFADVGDTSFIYVAQDDYQQFLQDSPLWNALPFVQADHAYWLGGDVWLFGGPLSAQILLDTVLASLGVDLPEATPEATAEATASA